MTRLKHKERRTKKRGEKNRNENVVDQLFLLFSNTHTDNGFGIKNVTGHRTKKYNTALILSSRLDCFSLERFSSTEKERKTRERERERERER